MYAWTAAASDALPDSPTEMLRNITTIRDPALNIASDPCIRALVACPPPCEIDQPAVLMYMLFLLGQSPTSGRDNLNIDEDVWPRDEL
eukprot:m.73685 g.73685  ORF g.73685 m.73685 type:complete len:88 (+) comp8037_c0_seq2:1512-1775(+)